MSLTESAPDTVATGDQSTGSPGQQSSTINSLAAAMAMAGVVVVTLGWTVLLVRVTIWIFQG